MVAACLCSVLVAPSLYARSAGICRDGLTTHDGERLKKSRSGVLLPPLSATSPGFGKSRVSSQLLVLPIRLAINDAAAQEDDICPKC